MSINPNYLNSHGHSSHPQPLNWVEDTPAKPDNTSVANTSGMFASISKKSLSPNKLSSKLDSKLGSLSSGLNAGASKFTPKKPTKKESKKDSGSQDEDGLMEGLFKIFLAALALPGKFESMFDGVVNSGIALGMGIEGLGQSLYLGVEDLVFLVIAIYTIISKYINCFISFLVNLPSCFISHVITCVFSVLYLIFPLTAWIFRMFTGFDLMPYFDAAFESISDGDDYIATYTGFNFLKFPPSIIKQCYTCNGKVVRVRDILKDVSKIKDVGDKISYDMTKTIPRYMKPAMPYIYKTANAIDRVFFQ